MPRFLYGARVSVTTRFAPSPTGRLHIGHAYSAIRAHDFARERGGRFLLRIEDIDGARSRAEHIDAILADLVWLGLEWDGPVVFQSARFGLYEAALGRLECGGLLYPCFCTRAAIAASVAAPHGAAPVYPATCRGVDASGRMSEPHCLRLDMTKAAARAGALSWADHGTAIAADPLSHGDVVLARKDAPASYHLAVTIDDAAQGVTVVRGRDLFEATHVHRLLQALLDLPTPRYHHHALIVGADGERLAKRRGAPTLAALREAGTDGRALAEELRAGHLPNGVASA